MHLKLVAFSVLVSTPALAGEDEQRATADRLLQAIYGQMPYTQSDFVDFPSDASRESLEILGKCDPLNVNRPLLSVEEMSNTFVEVPDSLAITFDCDGVPSRTPVGISLSFQGDRIALIETHNFDLLRTVGE